MNDEITDYKLNIEINNKSFVIERSDIHDLIYQIEERTRFDDHVGGVIFHAAMARNEENMRRSNPLEYKLMRDYVFYGNYQLHKNYKTKLESPDYFPGKYDPGFVYLVKCGDKYKIGKSKKPEYRFNSLEKTLGISVEPIHIISTDYYSSLERYCQCHFFFKDPLCEKHISGEYFKLDQDDIHDFIDIGIAHSNC